MDGGRAKLALQPGDDVVDEMGRARRPVGEVEVELFGNVLGLRLLRLVGADHPGRDHPVEDVQLTGPGAVVVEEGVVSGGRLEQAGQEGGLGDGQLGWLLAGTEVGLHGGADPVGAVAVVDPVQVQLEDLALRVAMLERVGEQQFLGLARDCLLRSEELDLHQLLGDRAAALRGPGRGDVDEQRPGHRGRVDGAVPVELAVFRGEGRGRSQAPHLTQLEDDVVVAFRVPLAEHLAVAVVDHDRLCQCRYVGRVGQRLQLGVDPAEGGREEGRDHHQSDHSCPASIDPGTGAGDGSRAAQPVPGRPRIHHSGTSKI